jgi:hypothetical protein
MKVLDCGIEVEGLTLFCVVECSAHGIRQLGMNMQELKIDLVRPPIAIGWRSMIAARWAFAVFAVFDFRVHPAPQLRFR